MSQQRELILEEAGGRLTDLAGATGGVRGVTDVVATIGDPRRQLTAQRR